MFRGVLKNTFVQAVSRPRHTLQMQVCHLLTGPRCSCLLSCYGDVFFGALGDGCGLGRRRPSNLFVDQRAQHSQKQLWVEALALSV